MAHPKDYCMNCDGKNKLAFIHIPRTAGKSIRKSFNLGHHTDKFQRINEYRCAHRRASLIWSKEIIDTFDTFSVIRDPWSRLVSLYHYYRGRPDVKNNYRVVNRYKNFSDFVLDLKNIPIAIDRNGEYHNTLSDNFQACSYFICDGKKVLVKNLIRFNNLNDDLKLFANKVNINIKFPLERFSKQEGLKHEYYTEYYNDKLIQKVADIYYSDIDMFGFDYK